MTPQQIAEVRPRLVAFAAQMLGGLARSDQRAAGELYVRGLLTDGRRKSMQPMAERLGVDHQRLQQFITSSTWDYAAVRRNVARWFAGSQPVEALVVDDTGFAKDGTASPCVARQYSGTLGKVGNCRRMGTAGAGHRRRRCPPGGGGRRGLRRQHHLPAGTGRPRLAVRAGRQGHHQRVYGQGPPGDAHPPAPARRRTCASLRSRTPARSSR